MYKTNFIFLEAKMYKANFILLKTYGKSRVNLTFVTQNEYVYLVIFRHGKSSNPSADILLEHYKFPQVMGFKLQQKGLICDKM